MQEEKKEITIYDIAKIADVSASTVSRVINDFPNVKKSTRARVLKALAENHYVPNETARGLVTQSSRMIGILISDIRTTHHTDGIYYIERELSSQGYSCLIYNTGSAEREQAYYIRLLSQRKVAALILMGSIYQTAAIQEAVKAYLPNIPVIICNGYLEAPNIYGLIADDQNGVCSCVRLLAEKNRKNLAFVVDHYTPSNRLKRNGFEIGVAQFCDRRQPLVVESGTALESVYGATMKLMEEHPETDGIIYAEDLLAVIGLSALAEMLIAVPEQVAVIGINNSLYAKISIPSLTSLDTMLYDLSLTAVRNLLSLLQGQHVNKKMMIYSEIIERKST